MKAIAFNVLYFEIQYVHTHTDELAANDGLRANAMRRENKNGLQLHLSNVYLHLPIAHRVDMCGCISL